MHKTYPTYRTALIELMAEGVYKHGHTREDVRRWRQDMTDEELNAVMWHGTHGYCKHGCPYHC